MATKDAAKDTVSEKAADQVHEAVDRLAASAKDAEERIRKLVAEAEGRLQSKSDNAQKRVEDLADSVGEYSREHPLATVGVAFAAGFLLSALLRR